MPLVSSFGFGNALTPYRFALFALPVLARLFVAFLELETLEQTVILNLLFQNAHGLFKVIVKNPYFDVLQISRPLRSKICNLY